MPYWFVINASFPFKDGGLILLNDILWNLTDGWQLLAGFSTSNPEAIDVHLENTNTKNHKTFCNNKNKYGSFVKDVCHSFPLMCRRAVVGI